MVLFPFDNFYLQKSVRLGGIFLGLFIGSRVLLLLIDQYRRYATKSSSDTPGLQGSAKRIETICSILRNTITIAFLIASIFILLTEVGINVAPLVAGAGVAGIAVGFGAQNLVKDLFYGFFILLENQFGIGDVIQVGDVMGQVERLTLRTVTLRAEDGRVYILPNGDVNKVIVHTKDYSCLNVSVEVAMLTDLNQAFDVIDAVNKQFYKDHRALLLEKPYNLGVESFTPRGMMIKILAKTMPMKQWELTRQYRKMLKLALDEAKIQIPVTP